MNKCYRINLVVKMPPKINGVVVSGPPSGPRPIVSSPVGPVVPPPSRPSGPSGPISSLTH